MDEGLTIDCPHSTCPATSPPCPHPLKRSRRIITEHQGRDSTSCFVILLRCQLHTSPLPVSAHSALVSVCHRDLAPCAIEFSVFPCKKMWDTTSERETLIFSARSVEAAVFPPMSGGSVIMVNDQVNNCL